MKEHNEYGTVDCPLCGRIFVHGKKCRDHPEPAEGRVFMSLQPERDDSDE